MEDKFSQYNTDYISGVMSLRKPQKKSLEILDNILKDIDLKHEDISEMLNKINAKYPTCTDFERDFVSLTFALATGTGKTRLMGTFITYLYTNYGLKDFFVVAPNKVIYEQLKDSLGNYNSPKYVFKGIGCFQNMPQVIADDDYREKNISMFDSDVKIFVYNIDKFNSEDNKMRAFNETLGKSFYQALADKKDLVLIMDESHHYRAERGWLALNDLKPILGLELTATPKVSKTNEKFKNVVYEYPLSEAIEDGYTRIPYALTRQDIDFHNFGDERLDKIILDDGFLWHERIKKELKQYSEINHVKLVKPFVLIVCKDIEHANKIYEYINSDNFRNGKYKDYKTQRKVIVLNYKQSKKIQDENNKLLQEVENVDNPVEVVIHVDKLKEGWDVDNLYTIIPLRTATSSILREQMVGRGLRLPYGKQTGVKDIDSVMLTAHDNFSDILKEAQSPTSIFHKGKLIDITEIENERTEEAQLSFADNVSETSTPYELENLNIAEKEKGMELQKEINKQAKKIIKDEIYNSNASPLDEERINRMSAEIENKISEDQDYGEIYKNNKEPLSAYLRDTITILHDQTIKKFIPIPAVVTEEEQNNEFYFENFDLDLSKFNQMPIKNNLIAQNLIDTSEQEKLDNDEIQASDINPERELVEELRKKAEIDYEKNSELIQKLVSEVTGKFRSEYGEDGIKNIMLMYRKEIANEIYKQMLDHFKHKKGLIIERVVEERKFNIPTQFNYNIKKNIFENYDSDRDGNIKSVLFDGIKKGIFENTKFDSVPELTLAKILEKETFVINWLRPARDEFNITYNHGNRYEPDFVVESDQMIYLVEVKADNQLEDEEVIEKKKKAIHYCKIVSEWAKVNNKKEWRYVFIPASKIQTNSSFENLVKMYEIESE